MRCLRLLGDLAVEEADGTVRRLKARKYAVLLAYLALHPRRAHAREEVIERFWPETPLEAGRVCLRSALTALRHEIDPHLFVDGARETLLINAQTLTTDAARFEQAARRGEDHLALQLYAGPLLPGFYDDWVIDERERLEALYEQVAARAERTPRPPAPKERMPLALRLPPTPNAFRGREAERAWLAARLADSSPRLITLTGTAGIGKTRLAIEAARDRAPQVPGAVCFVPLADCLQAEEILSQIAATLLIPPGPALTEGIAARLEDLGPSLLVLDNLEQLVERGAGGVLAGLLARIPSLTLLATSRQPLRIEGERVLPLQGLSGDADLQLFLDRAQAVRPDFSRNDANAADIDTLRQRLEGIPLALELCAAWAPLLTPRQMCERLNGHRELLTNPRQDAPARHRSLAAALAWGPPLPADLAVLFAALSVFAGGWTLEAAEWLMESDALLLPLAELQCRSLIVAEESAASRMRYRYLEPVRAFAAEQLSPEARAHWRWRHLEWVRLLAHEADHLPGDSSRRWFERMEQENANIRAALEFALTAGSDAVGVAMEILGSLEWSWWVRGDQPFHRTFLQRAYAIRSEVAPQVRAEILFHAALLVPDAEREACYQEAHALFLATGKEASALACLTPLARCAEGRDDLAGAMARMEEAAQRQRERGDDQGLAYARADQAGMLIARGDYARAAPYLKEAIGLHERRGDAAGAAKCRIALAVVLRETGDPKAAEAHCRAALATFEERGETWNRADALKGLGAALQAQGHTAEAQTPLKKSLALFEELGVAWQVTEVAALLAPR